MKSCSQGKLIFFPRRHNKTSDFFAHLLRCSHIWVSEFAGKYSIISFNLHKPMKRIVTRNFLILWLMVRECEYYNTTSDEDVGMIKCCHFLS